jgi:hypothetical protein
LDSFQQTLFAIGADVYKQADVDRREFAAGAGDVPKSNQEIKFNSDIDQDKTVKVDYEAID